MVRLRSRISLKRTDDGRLLLQSNPTRRALFGAIALVLVAAFGVSVDFGADFQREMIAGSVFYFVVVLVCAVVAGWNSVVLFDAREARVSFIKRIFGARIRLHTREVDGIRGVTLQSVELLKESERPRAGLLGPRIQNQIARRHTYYKLYLDLDDTREFLEDSSEPGELDTAGATIAEFLGVSFHKEEI